MGKRIIRNAAKCNHCGDVIESKHRHDLQMCSCKRIFVDGGHCYLRWGYTNKDDFIDLSEVEDVEEREGMSEKLKPCPFCETDEGLSIERSEPQPGYPLFYVHCNKCGVNSVPELTVEEAIKEWNYSISEGYLGGEGYENEWKAEPLPDLRENA